jgi:hypothetical protein
MPMQGNAEDLLDAAPQQGRGGTEIDDRSI